jgi:hypothetical protein
VNVLEETVELMREDIVFILLGLGDAVDVSCRGSDCHDHDGVDRRIKGVSLLILIQCCVDTDSFSLVEEHVSRSGGLPSQ